jgi:hypothetical protein
LAGQRGHRGKLVVLVFNKLMIILTGVKVYNNFINDAFTFTYYHIFLFANKCFRHGVEQWFSTFVRLRPGKFFFIRRGPGTGPWPIS